MLLLSSFSKDKFDPDKFNQWENNHPGFLELLRLTNQWIRIVAASITHKADFEFLGVRLGLLKPDARQLSVKHLGFTPCDEDVGSRDELRRTVLESEGGLRQAVRWTLYAIKEHEFYSVWRDVFRRLKRRCYTVERCTISPQKTESGPTGGGIWDKQEVSAGKPIGDDLLHGTGLRLQHTERVVRLALVGVEYYVANI